MEKDENFPAALPGSFLGVDYTGTTLDIDHDDHHQHQHQQFMPTKQQRIGEGSSENGNQMVDYMLNNNPTSQHHLANSGFCGSNSFDKLSFADVMQFADLGPKLALNQTSKACEVEEQETGIDPVYFLKFPVLNERLVLEDDHESHLLAPHDHDGDGDKRGLDGGGEEEEARVAESTSVQLQFMGNDGLHKSPPGVIGEGKNKRKRPRTMKTSEEVESQRMTHIAVERNRRKQMNEHLRVLRSLMPGSYVQRGDQASIIGGAIEFVRELEQLLQCLESQKRRRLYGDGPPRPIGDSSSLPPNNMQQQPQVVPPFFSPDQEQIKMEFETGLREETAESKSCLADVEVRVLGFDAMIKILCRRRPGQLIKTIAALEDLQLNILHTNITTIEQTVLYSFNVKVASEGRFAAEDIANSVQQILSFIQANGSI